MPDPRKPGRKRLVLIRLRPLWAYVDGIREFMRFFVQTTFEVEAVADRLQLVVHELLENAVKYGVDGEEVEVSVVVEGDVIEVAVSNGITDDQAARVRAHFDRVNDHAAEVAFEHAVARASEMPSSVSNLGLSRVRLEGQMNLSYEVRDGRILVAARGKR